MTRTHWFNKAAPGMEVACGRKRPDAWAGDLSRVTCRVCLRIAWKAANKQSTDDGVGGRRRLPLGRLPAPFAELRSKFR
jgi:hypothetical protein